MPQEFVIECRYQYREREGIVWTDWFVYDSTHIPEADAKEALKSLKKLTETTDRITKLKHEYRLKDADEFEQEHIEFLKRVEEAKADFKTIKKMKKPWLAKSRKERKQLAEMSNDEKVNHLAQKRAQIQ